MQQADIGSTSSSGSLGTNKFGEPIHNLDRELIESLIESLIETLDAMDGDPDAEPSGDEQEDSECLQADVSPTGVPIGQIAHHVMSEDDELDIPDEDDECAAAVLPEWWRTGPPLGDDDGEDDGEWLDDEYRAFCDAVDRHVVPMGAGA